ncbi:acetoacetate-CoA ligase [Lophium mytilinum]|uniref:Acetoacetate-CoA ligase n=1 Tax=Lophium mytilinum TaxID=390894 RepID=A0A6A6QY59_9PEZI|nr:acetoacetate-CoA ligase [Lophium mytilinum]
MATTDLPIPQKLWEHPDPESTRMYKFMQKANRKWGLSMKTFQDLYEWSVGETRNDFWREIWDEIELVHEGSFDQPVDTTIPMDALPHWFAGTRLNFTENLLYTPSPSSPSTLTTLHKADPKPALTQIREGNTEVATLTYGALRARVGLLSNALRAAGVKKGDRVALVASNSFDTLTCFLATAALGALWSSSSTDMGVKGVLDRLVQIRPKFVFVDDWAVYNGKTVDLRPKIAEIVAGLKQAEVSEFEAVVVQPRFEEAAGLEGVDMAVPLGEFLKKARGDEKLVCERVEFRDPFLIVYSSGTTGVPKCIVHSTGGVLVSAMKEGKLHRDSGPDTVLLQYTTTGWIMYLSVALTLLWGGRSVLYDGSPFQPDLTTFMKIVGEQRVTNLGTSPKYLHELQKASIVPRTLTNLSALRSVTSTGMVLSDTLFTWFYTTAFPPAVHLANISGGTDLAACFGMENPLTPLYVGGCQGPSLGTKVEVYDATIDSGPGARVDDGVPGELVATASFPNQPVFFWGKEGAATYQAAYFARFAHVWTHGDFIVVHPVTKQITFLGRADGVLNPSGVRFGSAEIYSVIENRFGEEVQDSICVGQRRPQDEDESVMLFLLMVNGKRFGEGLVERVRDEIGRALSKRHVPKYVFETFEIPTTVNLKKVELPVKQIVSGRIVKPSGTLLNPGSLDYYYQFAKVEEVLAKQGRVKSKL